MQRWFHSLNPSISKGTWSQDEDRLLIQGVQIYGTQWSKIAQTIRGRTDDACSKRYREALDPELKKTEWTSEEDSLLAQAVERHGSSWKLVGADLKRSSLACRNRHVGYRLSLVRMLIIMAPDGGC